MFFSKNRDKYGHRICVIRNNFNVHYFPGLPIQYDVLVEGLLVSGHVVCNNDKNYFDYERLISFSEQGKLIPELNLVD